MIQRKGLWRELGFLSLATLATYACLFWCLGCNNTQSDQQLKEQAAQTTEQVKQGAKVAAADAKVAAANAERKVDDIAEGVKEGMHGDQPASSKPSPDAIDINTATADQLATLPGITPARAKRIMDNRPYATPHALVHEGLVSEAEYARLSGRIVAQ
jgi:hypothetical protein